jgi:hypothetical protein
MQLLQNCKGKRQSHCFALIELATDETGKNAQSSKIFPPINCHV